jgi:hypothetical protein
MPTKTMWNNGDVQEDFFKNLKKFFPEGNYADQIADVLSISKDPAYRRIRGWKEITLSEVYKLMKHCNAQMSELLPSKETVPFHFRAVDNDHYKYAQFLQEVYLFLNQYQQRGISRFLSYPKEIPLFYSLMFDRVGYFRYFLYQKSMLGNDKFKDLKFKAEHYQHIKPEINTQIVDLYYQFGSEEFWGPEIFTNFLNQVDYYLQAGFFDSNQEITLLLDEIEELVNLIEIQALTGKKHFRNIGAPPTPSEQSFTLYHSDLTFGDNTIVIHLENGSKVAYIAPNSIYLMYTSNEEYANYLSDFLTNMASRSSSLAEISAKQQGEFFHAVRLLIYSYRKLRGY